MMARTQVAMDRNLQRRAKRRADDLGISLSEYIRRTLERDLRPKADVSILFNLGSSGGSNIANNKDEMLGEAFEAEFECSRSRSK